MSDPLYMAKASRGNRVALLPTDEASEAAVRRYGDGELLAVKVYQPRSLPMFRRWWAICQEIGQNQEPTRDKDSICGEIKVLAGHFNVVPVEGVEGVEIRMPKSISFERLTEQEWRDLYPSLELAGRQRFGNQFFEGDTW